MHRPENVVLVEADSESTTKNDIPRNHRANQTEPQGESSITIVSPCAKGTNTQAEHSTTTCDKYGFLCQQASDP